MSKVFLSHSSNDKPRVDAIYRKLVSVLGVDNVIMDSHTFQEGRKTESEIQYNLVNSELFVIFLSDAALNSLWVQSELTIASKKLAENNSYQICPIIIDGEVKYDDSRIPQWLKDSYNIQPIKSNSKIVSIILERMTEITRTKYTKIRDRQDLFVGRNEYLGQIEQRLDDYELQTPLAIFASGLDGVGRRTLLKKSLIKGNIVKQSYPFSEVSMERSESIEDFILKLLDLGFLSEDEVEISIPKINGLLFEEKKEFLGKVIAHLQKVRCYIVVKDNGCIINHRGEIVEWFKEVMKSDILEERMIFLIASKFRYFPRGDYDFHRVYDIKVPELEIKERRGLLVRYSKIVDLELDNEKLDFISDLLSGLPEQVYFAINKLMTLGWDKFQREAYSIAKFNIQRAEILLEEFKDKKEEMELLTLLCQFDSIGISYLLSIVCDNDEQRTKYQEFLDSFLLQGICETEGTLQEYIRVNDSIKDYILRSDYKLSSIHNQKIFNSVKDYISKLEDSDDFNVPELLFNIKTSLLTGVKIDEKYIFPSIYLKTMNDLYYAGKYNDVVEFADKAISRKNNYDENMIFEIRYLLCLALAKLSKQNNYENKQRFNQEVQNINGPDHDFLYGFYYRQIGKFDKALEKLDSSLNQRNNFSKAKREKVQVLLAMQDFPAAMELAQMNYDNYPNNPYHIQAYFSCVIRSDNLHKEQILKELIENIDLIGNEVSKEMSPRFKAQYAAFVEDDFEKAITEIDKAISINPTIQYARFVKFEIADRFGDIEMMNQILKDFEEAELKTKYHNNYIYMKSLILSREAGVDEAKRFFLNHIKNYTDQAKNRFMNRLENKYNQ
ncbi:toll/interleukin-1 receptor domain-containing protein [Streptococcus suis]|nr:toll/interleukin-1 receptor domain-containing protein [Streptococcus suis]